MTAVTLMLPKPAKPCRALYFRGCGCRHDGACCHSRHAVTGCRGRARVGPVVALCALFWRAAGVDPSRRFSAHLGQEAQGFSAALFTAGFRRASLRRAHVQRDKPDKQEKGQGSCPRPRPVHSRRQCRRRRGFGAFCAGAGTGVVKPEDAPRSGSQRQKTACPGAFWRGCAGSDRTNTRRMKPPELSDT